VKRAALEKKADKLGIPYTHQTTDDGLKVLIRTHSEESDMSGVELRDDGKYYYDGHEQPECFGVFWEAIPGSSGKQCRECAFNKVCLDRFIQTTLPKAEGSLGSKADAAEVGKKLDGLSAKAIEEARRYRDKQSPSKTEEAEMAPRNKKTKKKKKKVPAKKATSKKPAKKKPAKKAAKARPKKAPSAKRAKARAKSKKKNARSAKARAESGMVPWGEHTFQSRWEKERARSPLIAKLTPGKKLTVEWPRDSGDKYTVTCKKGHYEYNGTKFPTLYKVTEHITGEGSKWSGPKFWKLRQLFAS
jgi:hypothetical protein